MKLKSLLIIGLAVSILTAIPVGYGLVLLLKLLGANVFQPGAIYDIYTFAFVVIAGICGYFIIMHTLKKHREAIKEEARQEV